MITSNKNYFISCLFFLFFFIGWGCCYPYLSLWLTETIGINYTDVGMVYSFTAIVAVCVQPLFGFISDKLVYRKNLMWMLAIIITLFAPYWIYVFAPLLKINVFLGALAGGLYIGMAYGAGCGICEAYIDKVSRASGFEFGRARMFGGIGAAIGTFAAGKQRRRRLPAGHCLENADQRPPAAGIAVWQSLAGYPPRCRLAVKN